MAVRALLVDPHPLFRAGVRALLADDGGFGVVEECGEARCALEAVRRAAPQLAVVGIDLPDTNGIALAREIKRVERHCRVLILTAHTGEPFILQALDAGVDGFAMKHQPTAELLEAMQTVARGKSYVAPLVPKWIVERQFRRSRGEDVPGDPLTGLSRREREVFDLIVRGLHNDVAAATLSISVKTIETHRARINRKLGVHSTAELVRFAALRGLLRDADPQPPTRSKQRSRPRRVPPP